MFNIPWDDINKSVEDATARSFDSIFNSLDGLEAEVQGLMDKDLELYRDKVAEQIIDEASKKTALIGGGAAIPDILPLAGWSTFIAAVAADFALTLREDLSMLMRLAYLYGQDVSREDRKKQAVSLLAAVGAKEGKGNPTREVSKLMGMIGTKHISRKLLIKVGRRLGERFFKRKIIKLIPGVGILLSGGVNYYSTRALGEYAQDYFVECAETGERAAGIANEMKLFHELYLRALANMAKKDGTICDEELTSFKDSMLMFGYTAAEQEKCLEELNDLEAIIELEARECKKLSEQDRSFILKSAISMMYANRTAEKEQRAYLLELAEALDLPEKEVDGLETEVREDLGL